MSNEQRDTARAIARQTRAMIKGAGAALAGRERGPDWTDEPGARVPRRNSFEAGTPEAQPWRPIGDGSVGQGLAHREALLETAEELVHECWREQPLREIRDAQQRHDALKDELDGIIAGGPLPTGRAATVRLELSRLRVFLERAKQRLRRLDVTVLKALIKRVDFRTGKLYPSIKTIAADAACHRNSVVAALRRLKIHGFIDWVRRTVRTGNEGAFAPQLEQTSNAYTFDHQRSMAPRTWQRFTQRLVAKLRRLGKVPAGVAPGRPQAADIKDPELRASLFGLGSSVSHAST